MLIYSDVYRPLLGADNKSYLSIQGAKMIDEFHVMYMYKKNPSRSRNYRHQNT